MFEQSKTVGMVINNETAVYRPLVLHEDPHGITWVGNLDETKDQVDHVVPFIVSDDPSVVGSAIVRYLARDLTRGREEPGVFTDAPVLPDLAPTADAPDWVKAECFRTRMIRRVLVGRPKLEEKNKVTLLANLVYLLKVNFPEVSGSIETKKLRVVFKTSLLFKTAQFPESFPDLQALLMFCGETYIKMRWKILKHHPELIDLERFAA